MSTREIGRQAARQAHIDMPGEDHDGPTRDQVADAVMVATLKEVRQQAANAVLPETLVDYIDQMLAECAPAEPPQQDEPEKLIHVPAHTLRVRQATPRIRIDDDEVAPAEPQTPVVNRPYGGPEPAAPVSSDRPDSRTVEQAKAKLAHTIETAIACAMSQGGKVRITDDRERWERLIDTPIERDTDALILAVRQAQTADRPQPSDDTRTVASIAAMLGWGNVPPRETLEREINALKARAQGSTVQPSLATITPETTPQP